MKNSSGTLVCQKKQTRKKKPRRYYKLYFTIFLADSDEQLFQLIGSTETNKTEKKVKEVTASIIQNGQKCQCILRPWSATSV